ncbi:MAG: monovalent cation:proton antiporter-2 (CPA2) family protein [Pseudomonadota bacterium]
MSDFLIQAALYLGAGLIAVPLAMRFKLGSVLGYLLAGLCIGPALGLVSETEDILHFAEFGVVMMLFIIGLELEPRVLWQMRTRLLGLGGLQVSVTAALVALGVSLLGYDWRTALAIGLIFSLSSTAIVLQTLNEKGLMATGGGRASFSVLLAQDIAVIPMLALLPLLAVMPDIVGAPDGSIIRQNPGADHHDAGHHGVSLVAGLPGWGVTLVTLGAVASIVLVGRYLTHPLYHLIARTRLRELNTAFALFIVVSIAVLMNMVGLSPALGAFLAGVVLANSEFRHELESAVEPFKGLLLGLFFITVGAGIDLGLFASAPLTILGLTFAMILLKGGVLYVLGWVFKLRERAHWLFTLSLAQAGEFGFVLITFAQQTEVLLPSMAQLLLLIVALSMLITPLLFIAYERLTHRLGDAEHPEPDEISEQDKVIIAGIGRFGQIVNRMLQAAGMTATVLDNDVETIRLMRTFGFKGYYGDPSNPGLLEAAGIDDAKVLVVAIDDDEAALKLVAYARRLRPDLHIIARARDRVHTYKLVRAGASQTVRETFDSSLRAGRYVLQAMDVAEFDAYEHEKAFYRHDRHVLHELSELWDPDVPISQNKAYIERARELEREVETQIVAAAEKEANPR